MIYNVNCVCKNSNGIIVGVGTTSGERFSKEKVEQMIISGNEFYTYTHPAAKIIIARHLGHLYIKTAADTTTINNLDHLPLCDGHCNWVKS